jgi:nucleotide-binding universal stress UspA family protein
MSGVVCAIRGGPHSKPTIRCAIDLAVEHHCPLHFLYIVNVEFLSRTTLSRVSTISQEMHSLGEFIMLAAQAEAEKQGVAANGVVREGNVGDEIVALCRETGSDYVVLGRPHVKGEENVFTHELLQQFDDRIREETGARVVYPAAGES